jgi:hypothetical protein
MYGLSTHSCERGRKGSSLNFYYIKNNVYETRIYINEKNNHFSIENVFPRNSINLIDSSLLCNNNDPNLANLTNYYCNIDFQIKNNSTSQITFQGLKPYEKHLLIFTASSDTSCLLR